MKYDAQAHWNRLYENITPEFAFAGETAADVANWQAAFRPRLRLAVGLDAMAVDLAGHRPEATCRGREELAEFIREDWTLTVEPDVPLPFYLLRPKAPAPGPLPLVLCPHGHNHPYIYAGIAHNEAEREQMLGGDRDIGVQAVREGYLAICPTTRAFGETRTAQDQAENNVHSCIVQFRHGLLVGRTPVGERIWDMSRLIDWALANENVDPRRIAITGNSGGGTISLFTAACEPRITVAAPSGYFCTFAGSIGSIYHCACNYVPGMLRMGEMADVAGLTAPRPFLAISGLEDPIFPIEHARAAFARLQQIYAAAAVPDFCEHYVGNGGHRYYAAGAWPFIGKHFARLAGE